MIHVTTKKLKKRGIRLEPFNKKKFDLLRKEDTCEKWFSPNVGIKYKIIDSTTVKYRIEIKPEKQKNVDIFKNNISFV